MEVRIYPEGTPFPFTHEWYAARAHADHKADPWHHVRFAESAAMVQSAIDLFGVTSLVDLGGGDGGFLQTLRDREITIPAWGYDLMPTNVDYGVNVRGQDIRLGDFLTSNILWGACAVITECLEHLEDPHGALRLIRGHSRVVIASSPCRETLAQHDECHAWCWDMQGYRELFEGTGWQVHRHIETYDNYGFQVIMAVAK